MDLSSAKDTVVSKAGDPVTRSLVMHKGKFGSRYMTVYWLKMAPRSTQLLTTDPDEPERSYLVTAGEAVASSGTSKVSLKMGDLGLIRPGEVHRLANVSSKPAEVLVFGSPILDGRPARS